MPPSRRSGTPRRASSRQAPSRPQSANPLVGAVISAVIQQREAQMASLQPFYENVLRVCKLSRAEIETLSRSKLEERLTAALNALSGEQLNTLSQQAIAASQGGIETVIVESTRAALLDEYHIRLTQLAKDAPQKLDAPELQKRILEEFKTLPPLTPEMQAVMEQWVQSKFPTPPAPASRSVELPDAQHDEPPQMAAQKDDTITVAKDGTFIKGGVRYHSLYAAAPLAHTHPTTLLNWIKHSTKLNGKTLQTFYFAPADKYLISEESIERAANRFIKWPSKEPAGNVAFGSTDDGSGYITLAAARAVIGISNRTMYLWAAQEKAPRDKPLDVIKDPISEHLYIRERDVYELKRLVPRSGLQRGRRPISDPSPA